MQVETAEELLQSLVLNGGAIITTGQITDSTAASILVGGTRTESFIADNGIGFVRVDRVPSSIPHAEDAA